jgi:hypothetical protein
MVSAGNSIWRKQRIKRSHCEEEKKLKKQEQGYLLHDKKNCIFLPFLSSLDRKNLKSWWTLLQFFYLSSKT